MENKIFYCLRPGLSYTGVKDMIFMKIRVLGNRRFKNVGQAGVRQERVCRQTEGTTDKRRRCLDGDEGNCPSGKGGFYQACLLYTSRCV